MSLKVADDAFVGLNFRRNVNVEQVFHSRCFSDRQKIRRFDHFRRKFYKKRRFFSFNFPSYVFLSTVFLAIRIQWRHYHTSCRVRGLRVYVRCIEVKIHKVKSIFDCAFIARFFSSNYPYSGCCSFAPMLMREWWIGFSITNTSYNTIRTRD